MEGDHWLDRHCAEVSDMGTAIADSSWGGQNEVCSSLGTCRRSLS